jgi:dTDP-4-amino-4,6-dideoxygalactose transaminase
MDSLALLGGGSVRTEEPIVGYDPTRRSNFDEAEIEAVTEVLEGGRLSGFVAGPSEEFYGGPKLRELEAAWSEYFDVDHAIAVNSWTSGLFASVAAADLSPGDEVIVPPLTMSATATAVLGNNAVPVFADVNSETANIDPDAVRECITDQTEAILLVHLFGYPAEMDELVAIADEHDLLLIEDAAQAIGATYNGEYVGTIGDIGGFSLNVHKHIQSGEGGIITTDDDELAQRARLVRNHAEAVVGDIDGSYVGELPFDADSMIGQNYRMTELAAAVGREQLRKLPTLLERRIERADQLRSLLQNVRIVSPGPIREGSTHSYYGFPLWYDPSVGGVPLEIFIEALNAEGIPAGQYVEPLYKLPVYQKGNVHSNGLVHDGNVAGATPVTYSETLCPVAEKLHSEQLIWMDTVVPEASESDIRDVATAIEKIERNADQLREYAQGLSESER